MRFVRGGFDMPIEEKHNFHGFSTPQEALVYYYKHELNDRHTECFEFTQEKKLLEWLYRRDLENNNAEKK